MICCIGLYLFAVASSSRFCNANNNGNANNNTATNSNGVRPIIETRALLWPIVCRCGWKIRRYKPISEQEKTNTALTWPLTSVATISSATLCL